MTEFVAAVRVILAVVFVVSAVAKLRDREGSREAVEAFGVPAALVGVVAGGLPFAELACALLLVLPDPFATTGAIASLVLLGAFTAAVTVNLVRGNRVDCHCFGSMGDQGTIGWHTVVRNGVFMLLAALSLVGAGSLESVPEVVADMSGILALLWVLALLAVAVLVGMGVVLQQLITGYGAALLRIEALEQGAGTAELVPAPMFTLPDLDGELVSLEEKLSDGMPAVVVFVSPGCHNCTELLPDLAAYQRDNHGPHVVVLSDGTVADNRDKASESGEIQILLQADKSLSEQVGILGTPAAILVGVDGNMAGGVIHGPDPIRSLIVTTHNTLLGPPDESHDHGPVHQIEGRPLGAGDEAPEVSLASETDEPLTAEEAFGDADGTVALFWRHDCGFCAGILDQVKELEATTPVRLVTVSTVEQIRATGLASPIVRDGGGVLSSWLGVPGTPSAARLKGGVLDSGVAIGGPNVLELLRSTQGKEQPGDGPDTPAADQTEDQREGSLVD
jgi:peroxiredoxin